MFKIGSEQTFPQVENLTGAIWEKQRIEHKNSDNTKDPIDSCHLLVNMLVTSSSLSRSWKIPSSSSVSTSLSSFSLAALAVGSTTAATDGQEIFPVLEIKLIFLDQFCRKMHFTSYSYPWYTVNWRCVKYRNYRLSFPEELINRSIGNSIQHSKLVYSYVRYRVPYPATQLLTSKSKNSEQNINTKKERHNIPHFRKQ